MYALNHANQTMQAVHNPREKYSNLLFFLFNALFLLAIFWMLPALGGDPDQSATASGRAGLRASASRQPSEKSIMAQTQRPSLLTQAVTFILPKLPR
jgi:hypothetical protein